MPAHSVIRKKLTWTLIVCQNSFLHPTGVCVLISSTPAFTHQDFTSTLPSSDALVNEETCNFQTPVRVSELRIFSGLDASPDPRSQLPQTTLQPSKKTIQQRPLDEPDETAGEADARTSDAEVKLPSMNQAMAPLQVTDRRSAACQPYVPPRLGHLGLC